VEIRADHPQHSSKRGKSGGTGAMKEADIFFTSSLNFNNIFSYQHKQATIYKQSDSGASQNTKFMTKARSCECTYSPLFLLLGSYSGFDTDNFVVPLCVPWFRGPLVTLNRMLLYT
jgi:hypothetical protein